MRNITLSFIYGILLWVLGIYLLITLTGGANAGYYDNTSVESRVNVTNKAPFVRDVNMYLLSNLAESSIDLTEGTTTTIICNATIDDWNGWLDIADVNASIYDVTSFTSTSPNDNNSHYFQGSCAYTPVPNNNTAIMYSCSFDVWYFANSGAWNCNVSAIDHSNVSSNAVDLSNPSFSMLAALNLSTNLIDFGNMQPGDITTDALEPLVNVTNTGNVNINLSLDGFGVVDGDGLAMDCDVGNISLENLRYNVTNDQSFTASMWNLTDTKLTAGIPRFTIPRRVDDSDYVKLNSTNTTFWKLQVPIGSAGGFCNGTVTFSAVV